ncbi:MAG: heavy-metal-associated domain-containing protein [Chitinophagaceae bacterium]
MEASNIFQNREATDMTVPITKSISKTHLESRITCACCADGVESNPTHPEIVNHASENLASSTFLDEIAIPEESFTFKTNINCGGCRAKVAPALEAENAIQKWEVDLHSPDKTLTVTGRGVSAEQIMKAVRTSGYFIEPIISEK